MSNLSQESPSRLIGDHAAALRLVADVRAAIGDNGKRMQPELIEYCKAMKRDADEITQTREALRRVHRWCLTAYDAGVAAGVRRWIEGGMIGKLPPMPKWILECYPEERAIDAANGGGNG